MNFQEAYELYKTYANSLEEPDYSVHIEDTQESKVRVMNEREFEWELLNDRKFRDKWSNGCVRDLTLEERANTFFLQHPDWAMSVEHVFFDGHGIPRRKVVK
jgi:hypothetical protein